jgi:uncharacterized protein
MTEQLLTPSKITAWLDCAHYLSLRRQVETGLRDAPGGAFGAFAQLLLDKGLEHERDCLADYTKRGLSVYVVPNREKGESFAAWVERIGDPFTDGHDVIYQMPFVHNGIRGIADFLERVIDDEGTVSYEPVDAKLARKEAKPGHVLQLCFYADAIQARTGKRPRRMYVWLGSGLRDELVVDEFAPYWRRIRKQLAEVLADEDRGRDTTPEPCSHCAFCEFFDVCTEQWRAEDALHYVAGLRSVERDLLVEAGVTKLADLAAGPAAVDGVRPERLLRLVDQAVLQAEAQLGDEDALPPYRLIEPGDDPNWGHGFEQLPAPDDGDVFLDFEGHPFWTPRTGLFFLFGLILQRSPGDWVYQTWWAHDLAEERAAVEALVDFLDDRRTTYPDMHVYHYNHTERSSLERLTTDHATREAKLAHLVGTGAFIDLLAVVRNSMQVGTESYGLKAIERLAEYRRGHDIDAGAGAVVSYERWRESQDQAELDAIASYNEDDVRATLALRDWLVANRPIDLPWRAATVELVEDSAELDELVEALHAVGPQTPEYVLGDVIGYWKREWLAVLAPRLVKCQADPTSLLDDPEALTCLVAQGEVPRYGAKGQLLKIPAMRFSLPDQETGELADGSNLIYCAPDGTPCYSSIDRLDLDTNTLDLMWRPPEDGSPRPVPGVVVHNSWVPPRPKPEALGQLANRMLGGDSIAPNRVALALLRRDLPAFTSGGGPPDGVFSDDLDEMTAWAPALDGSYVAIQGPPGTGKTFRLAHLALALIRAGKRVGITAFSHNAIDNALGEVIKVMTDAGELGLLDAVRRGNEPPSGPLPHVTYAGGNRQCAGEFNLVAGTTWLFAGDDMAGAPVDVLLVDEAGQLALADTLAAARSARNLILLGDQLQLPQVSQAVHPGSGGLSALEHVLGDDVTIPPERGVFLTETRRMHPDVCRFISHEIYEGRLTSHDSCAQQTTVDGTGLRWIRATHEGCVTSSPEEAEIVVAEIRRLMGTPWTDRDGVERPLGPTDFMVVAPYNDQVNLIENLLAADPALAGVPVGSVDRFQGRQAAVVFFSMATSTGEDIHRGADFLFSRNRLNVAVSRAKCLAVLVCTDALLNSRARDVDDMRLISTLCAFVEQAT